MRVLVCGGRDYGDKAALFKTLDAYDAVNPIDCVIHGAARGADTLAGEWASERAICCDEYPANWDRDGKAAGPIRNRLMLTDGKPDLVIAFPGGRGTANMMQQAKAAGVAVREI